MNEQIARDAELVRAIETTDRNREILSDDDRMYASRSAIELAQWQASDAKAGVSTDHFLQQRSEQVLKRLSERIPAFAMFVKRRNVLPKLFALLPFLALLAGVGIDRIADPHRVDLLSAPLLLIIGWNLLVYIGLLVSLCLPASKPKPLRSGLMRMLGVGKVVLPRKIPHALSAGLLAFIAEWAQLSAKLTMARVSRTIHLSAALFAVGAMASLYARGFLSQYLVGWESTFLDASQVHASLSVLFAPAVSILHLQGFSVAEIEALRFTKTSSAIDGARWVHLYAATLFLLVVLPRAVLAAVAHWQARKLESHFPLDLDQPYYRKLDVKRKAESEILRILPYSFTIDEARDKGLAGIAAMLLGDQARVMLRPSSSYGEEPQDALAETALDDAKVALTAVLFNLAATPEKENHGAFLDYLVSQSARGIAVLIDESSYLERFGAQPADAARLAERIALWQQFCNYHHAPATIVNLIDPTARPLDIADGLSLSKAK